MSISETVPHAPPATAGAPAVAAPRTRADYRLIGGAGARAAAAGLAGATWYQCAVPRAVLKGLMKRDDARAVRDTVLWFGLIALAGAVLIGGQLAGWGVGPLGLVWLVYATLYGGAADSRWHECSHGTAFRTRGLNDNLYAVASFMVLRRPTRWRWSHARHHTDTLITGRDPEVAVPVPVDRLTALFNLFALISAPREVAAVLANATGRIAPDERSFVPESSWPNMVREARIWVAVWLAVVLLAWGTGSWLPLLLVGPLPSMGGSWLHTFFGFTQHAGLPENVLDHRMNCRTVRMNPVFGFLYWNMNYHVEHHMFPMVPYHALPALHEAIRADCPPAYSSTLMAWREIIPAIWRQARDPAHFVVRPLPRAMDQAPV